MQRYAKHALWALSKQTLPQSVVMPDISRSCALLLDHLHLPPSYHTPTVAIRSALLPQCPCWLLECASRYQHILQPTSMIHQPRRLGKIESFCLFSACPEVLSALVSMCRIRLMQGIHNALQRACSELTVLLRILQDPYVYSLRCGSTAGPGQNSWTQSLPGADCCGLGTCFVVADAGRA